MAAPRRSVLFVCTHNSARSQMAEGLLRARAGGRFDVASAGTEPGRPHPLAVVVMREIDIDIGDHTSKHVQDVIEERTFDVVATVCDHARESCPYIPARERNLHESFPDPSSVIGPADVQLQAFRDVRDRISVWLEETFFPVEL